MESQATTDAVIRFLASQQRVLVLGGVAVISHGLDRNTHDADIWLDPGISSQAWSVALSTVWNAFPGIAPIRIAQWNRIDLKDLAEIIETDGVCRLIGMERPLDIFRRPNEFEIENFDAVWELATPQADGTRLPDAIDLLVTKQITGREKDHYDIAFLEGKINAQYARELPLADASRALAMLDRFLTPTVAGIALQHPDPEVRKAGKQFLIELAEAGDPFAAEMLRDLQASENPPAP